MQYDESIRQNIICKTFCLIKFYSAKILYCMVDGYVEKGRTCENHIALITTGPVTVYSWTPHTDGYYAIITSVVINVVDIRTHRITIQHGVV